MVLTIAERHARNIDDAPERLDARLVLDDLGRRLQDRSHHAEHGVDLGDLPHHYRKRRDSSRHLAISSIERHVIGDGYMGRPRHIVNEYGPQQSDERDEGRQCANDYRTVVSRTRILRIAMRPFRKRTILGTCELDLLNAA